jgi:hypothetical protein
LLLLLVRVTLVASRGLYQGRGRWSLVPNTASIRREEEKRSSWGLPLLSKDRFGRREIHYRRS